MDSTSLIRQVFDNMYTDEEIQTATQETTRDTGVWNDIFRKFYNTYFPSRLEIGGLIGIGKTSFLEKYFSNEACISLDITPSVLNTILDFYCNWPLLKNDFPPSSEIKQFNSFVQTSFAKIFKTMINDKNNTKLFYDRGYFDTVIFGYIYKILECYAAEQHTKENITEILRKFGVAMALEVNTTRASYIFFCPYDDMDATILERQILNRNRIGEIINGKVNRLIELINGLYAILIKNICKVYKNYNDEGKTLNVMLVLAYAETYQEPLCNKISNSSKKAYHEVSKFMQYYLNCVDPLPNIIFDYLKEQHYGKNRTFSESSYSGISEYSRFKVAGTGITYAESSRDKAIDLQIISEEAVKRTKKSGFQPLL
jgi:hypothetical protein